MFGDEEDYNYVVQKGQLNHSTRAKGALSGGMLTGANRAANKKAKGKLEDRVGVDDYTSPLMLPAETRDMHEAFLDQQVNENCLFGAQLKKHEEEQERLKTGGGGGEKKDEDAKSDGTNQSAEFFDEDGFFMEEEEEDEEDYDPFAGGEGYGSYNTNKRQHNQVAAQERSVIFWDTSAPKFTEPKNGLRAWDGVFMPVTVSILGVITFLKLPFLVAQCGLILFLGLLLLCYFVSGMTTISIAALSTNGSVGEGGPFHMVSRNLGAAAGLAVGNSFVLGNLVTGAFFVTGSSHFAIYVLHSDTLEEWANEELYISTVVTASILLLILLGVALLKLARGFRAVSLVCFVVAFFDIIVSCFHHDPSVIGRHGFEGFSFSLMSDNLWPDFREGMTAQAAVAILFPSVGGILAGLTMSGEIRHASKAIPTGIFWAWISTLVCYILMAFFIAGSFNRYKVGDKQTALMDVTRGYLYIPGALLSCFAAALANIVGSSRVLYGMSQDHLLHGVWLFDWLQKRTKVECVLLCWAGIQISIFCIGDHYTAASIVGSLVILSSYAALNAGCFLSSVSGIVSFRPVFNFFSSSSALLGTASSFIMMFFIQPLGAAITIMVVITTQFLVANYMDPSRVHWGDASQPFTFFLVRKLLLNLDETKEHIRHWRPSLLHIITDVHLSQNLIHLCNNMKKGGLLEFFMVLEGGFAETAASCHGWKHWFIHYLASAAIKAFAIVTFGTDLRSPLQQIVRAAGLGGMRPNSIMMSLDELDFSPQHRSSKDLSIDDIMRFAGRKARQQLSTTSDVADAVNNVNYNNKTEPVGITVTGASSSGGGGGGGNDDNNNNSNNKKKGEGAAEEGLLGGANSTRDTLSSLASDDDFGRLDTTPSSHFGSVGNFEKAESFVFAPAVGGTGAAGGGGGGESGSGSGSGGGGGGILVPMSNTQLLRRATRLLTTGVTRHHHHHHHKDKHKGEDSKDSSEPSSPTFSLSNLNLFSGFKASFAKSEMKLQVTPPEHYLENPPEAAPLLKSISQSLSGVYEQQPPSNNNNNNINNKQKKKEEEDSKNSLQLQSFQDEIEKSSKNKKKKQEEEGEEVDDETSASSSSSSEDGMFPEKSNDTMAPVSSSAISAHSRFTSTSTKNPTAGSKARKEQEQERQQIDSNVSSPLDLQGRGNINFSSASLAQQQEEKDDNTNNNNNNKKKKKGVSIAIPSATAAASAAAGGGGGGEEDGELQKEENRKSTYSSSAKPPLHSALHVSGSPASKKKHAHFAVSTGKDGEDDSELASNKEGKEDRKENDEDEEDDEHEKHGGRKAKGDQHQVPPPFEKHKKFNTPTNEHLGHADELEELLKNLRLHRDISIYADGVDCLTYKNDEEFAAMAYDVTKLHLNLFIARNMWKLDGERMLKNFHREENPMYIDLLSPDPSDAVMFLTAMCLSHTAAWKKTCRLRVIDFVARSVDCEDAAAARRHMLRLRRIVDVEVMPIALDSLPPEVSKEIDKIFAADTAAYAHRTYSKRKKGQHTYDNANLSLNREETTLFKDHGKLTATKSQGGMGQRVQTGGGALSNGGGGMFGAGDEGSGDYTDEGGNGSGLSRQASQAQYGGPRGGGFKITRRNESTCSDLERSGSFDVRGSQALRQTLQLDSPLNFGESTSSPLASAVPSRNQSLHKNPPHQHHQQQQQKLLQQEKSNPGYGTGEGGASGGGDDEGGMLGGHVIHPGTFLSPSTSMSHGALQAQRSFDVWNDGSASFDAQPSGVFGAAAAAGPGGMGGESSNTNPFITTGEDNNNNNNDQQHQLGGGMGSGFFGSGGRRGAGSGTVGGMGASMRSSSGTGGGGWGRVRSSVAGMNAFKRTGSMITGGYNEDLASDITEASIRSDIGYIRRALANPEIRTKIIHVIYTKHKEFADKCGIVFARVPAFEHGKPFSSEAAKKWLADIRSQSNDMPPMIMCCGEGPLASSMEW